MGWREVIAACVATTKDPWTGVVMVGRGALKRADAVHAALLSMPAPDRIALARELLAGTGLCVAREVGDIPLVRPRQLGESEAHDRGWNACRAAMLGEGE